MNVFYATKGLVLTVEWQNSRG